MDNLDRAVALVLTLVLAWLTKKYVEDRFRTPQWGIPLRKPFLLGAVGMVVVIAIAGLQQLEVDRKEADSTARIEQALSVKGPCFGAAILNDFDRCPPVPYDEIVPAPANAASDKSNAYKDVSGRKDCWSFLPGFRQVHCSFGNRRSDTEIALVGNSHAGQWLPALEDLAAEHNWRVNTYLASRCASLPLQQEFETDAHAEACLSWVERTVEAVVADDPDAVVITNRVSAPAEGKTRENSFSAYAKAWTEVLERFDRAGLRVMVLHDTPATGMSTPDCLVQNKNDLSACDGTREEWLAPEPGIEGVKAVDSNRIRFVDLTDHICAEEVCHAVTGGVVTYFDSSHLTATFVRTLAPYLNRPLTKLLTR
jgi:hypothetical protein